MNLLGYEATVLAMRKQGVPEEKILRFAREQWPDVAAQQDAAAEKAADILEKAEQTEVVKIFRAFKFEVRNLSQFRPSKVAPGLPDLFVTHRELPIGFFWETKRQVGARVSEAQKQFRVDCLRCRIGHGFGDRHAARSHLIALGIATVVNGALEPVR